MKRYDNILANPSSISSNEKYAILNNNMNQLLLVELGQGEELFIYGFVGRPRRINSVDIAQDARMFGLISSYSTRIKLPTEIEEKEKNIQVLLVGFDGGKIWSKTFPFEGGRLFLRLSDDGKQMLIEIGSKVMIYQQVDQPVKDGNEKEGLNFATYTDNFTCSR